MESVKNGTPSLGDYSSQNLSFVDASTQRSLPTSRSNSTTSFVEELNQNGKSFAPPIEGVNNTRSSNQQLDKAGCLDIVDSSGDESSSNEDVQLEKDEPKQRSFITIFSIWNTMMGTSILAMPWAIQQAGFAFGIFLILFVAGLACYTGYLAIKTTEDVRILQRLKQSVFLDFSDACRYHLGRAGSIVALVFSLIALLGALIVYYVLLCNFLFFIGDFIHTKVTGSDGTGADVICLRPPINGTTTPSPNLTYPVQNSTEPGLYEKLWSQTLTVPFWLLLLVFPLVSIKSPTFLSKFTTIGTISVVYLFLLICVKAGMWGIHMDFMSHDPDRYIPQFSSTFPSLTGVCSLAFFVHNALQTLTRSQRKPQHNGRDVIIAFLCTTVTYVLIGLVFYSAFPLAKSCLEDNLLNNLVTDIPVFIARLFLLFQMLTIYPMVTFVLRAQLMQAIFQKVYPGFLHVTVLHVITIGLGLLFAIFMPNIGTIIRFSGALCGMIYIFTLPPLITLLNKRQLIQRQFEIDSMSAARLTDLESTAAIGGGSRPLLMSDQQQQQKKAEDTMSGDLADSRWPDRRTQVLWWLRVVVYCAIMLFGLSNFIAQFVVFFVG